MVSNEKIYNEQDFWNIMESEAIEKYYIDNAEFPAIMVHTIPWVHPDAKYAETYTLYFGSGIAHYNFKSLKAARNKATEILETTKKVIEVTVKDKGNGLLKCLVFAPKKAGDDHV